MQGLIGSDTNACNATDSIGRRNPAMSAKTPECPATTIPIFLQAIAPLVVSTPTTLPSIVLTPVTSHCWIICIPISEQARAYPHATASCLAVPPRGCHSAPRTGYLGPSIFIIGQSFLTFCGLINSVETPCRALA